MTEAVTATKLNIHCIFYWQCKEKIDVDNLVGIKGLRPCPHVAGYFRKRRLFSRIRLPSTRKRRLSNTLSRVEIFENGDLSYSCGRAKTEVFKYDGVMPTISDNNIGEWLPFPPDPLPNVVLQVQKNIERKVDIIVATLKEGKRGRAFVWRWPETFGWDCRFKARSSAHTNRKRYMWTQIFLNTEKKISVFENTRLRVDEA